jgi:hypothetical protein
MADIIELTDKPIRNTAATIQELRLALDVGSYDELDLLLTMYEGTSIVIEVWTGMQTETEEGWVLAGTFTTLSAQGEAKMNVKNFLRFLRWKHVTASTATFLINGIGRRWA